MDWQAGRLLLPSLLLKAHLSSLSALDDTRLGFLWHSCWFQAFGDTGGFPGLRCSCGLMLPALGHSLLPCPLSSALTVALADSPFLPLPQSQVLCPFVLSTPISGICCLMPSGPGCPTTELSPGGTPFIPHFPPASTPSPGCCGVALLSSLFSFLFCFLSLWQGPTVRCILPDPPAPLASQRPPRRRWRQTCKDC